MDELYIAIERTRKGQPAIWVGGGATSNRFSAQFVLRDGKLAPAVFIKTSGYRCNSEQALVPLREGDVVVGVSGMRPATPENPVIGVHGWRVNKFEQDDGGNYIAITEYISINLEDIPSSVWEGCNVYHNRDARYFVADE